MDKIPPSAHCWVSLETLLPLLYQPLQHIPEETW